MENTESERFGNAIEALGAAYNREISGPLLKAYWWGLMDLPWVEVQKAIAMAIRMPTKFMPTPGELREMAGIMPQSTRSLRAWAAVKKAVADHGVYNSVDFEPGINAAIRNLGGWDRICNTEPGESFDKWLRKDFERIYELFCQHGVNHAEARHLPGYHERDAKAGGYKLPKVCKVEVDVPPVKLLGKVGNEATGPVRNMITELANQKGE